jgi:hypothetical protein
VSGRCWFDNGFLSFILISKFISFLQGGILVNAFLFAGTTVFGCTWKFVV